jgi:hypothetical protein
MQQRVWLLLQLIWQAVKGGKRGQQHVQELHW